MKKAIMALCALLVLGVCPHKASGENTGEKALLDGAVREVQQAAEKTEDARQKRCLLNAAGALKAAVDGIEQGDKEAALKNKRSALKWYVQAVRECMGAGEAAEKIAEALRLEDKLSPAGMARLKTLLSILMSAKESREKSDMPFFQGMALNHLLLGLFEIIDSGGLDGFEPEKALRWYINAAASCEDVQKLINELLDYLAGHTDETGIPDISQEACQKAKGMVERLYKLKNKGASSEEIVALAEEIKKFIDDEGASTGKKRIQKLEEDYEKERVSSQTTTVRFTALDGATNINRNYVGKIETITFMAHDGNQVPPQQVEPDVIDHGDHHTLSIKKAAGIASVVIAGSAGVLTLVQDGHGKAREGLHGIEPKDGDINVGNGSLEETLNMPDGMADMAAAPGEHAVFVAGTPIDIVALREDQAAVAGSGVMIGPAGGVPVKMLSPAGAVSQAIMPGWAYTVSLSGAVKTNAPNPVMAEVAGLQPDAMVTFRFMPGPGQRIEPPLVTMPAGALSAPTPVATLVASEPGPQGMDVLVTVEKR